MKQILYIFYFLFAAQTISAQLYDDFIGVGHSEGVIVTSSDPQAEGIKTIDASGMDLDIQGSSRFLAHATLGATIEEIQEVTDIGIDQWIDEQIALPASNYTLPTVEIIFELLDYCREELGDSLCFRQFQLNTGMWRYAWWHNTMTGEDKLRQRVAMALSEIIVVSDRSDLNNIPHGLAFFYDILASNAFGNYRDILSQVTLSPAMGFYLSHLNNPKSIPILNISPDENYAREIMQLFSIGLYELNADGSRIKDLQGLWIPTYTNEDIKGLAKVFTGLSGSKWANEDIIQPVQFGRRYNAYSFLDPMAMYEDWHEPGPKTIIGNYTIPSGQTGMQDIEEAIDHLFNHANVGPFLATRLIQRLVKSNPTPSYIERVANVFADNGSGVRGDLGATVKAILTDQEAIECYWIDDYKNGMLREPMLRYTQMMLGLKAETQSDWFWNTGLQFNIYTGQHVLSSPTVFNFYAADYVPNADFAYEDAVGPEFQILDSSTSSNYVNYMLLALNREVIMNRFEAERYFILNEPQFIPNYVPNRITYEAVLSDPVWLGLKDAPEDLVDYLDVLLANGQLSDERKEGIVESMKRTDLFTPEQAAHYAAFLVMIDPDYLIMK